MKTICKALWFVFETFGKTSEYLIVGIFDKVLDIVEAIEKKAKGEGE